MRIDFRLAANLAACADQFSGSDRRMSLGVDGEKELVALVCARPASLPSGASLERCAAVRAGLGSGFHGASLFDASL
jgi:hypothetical protein